MQRRMRVLTALLIADDRPGHYHLSDGVVAAARRLRPIRVIRLQVRRRWSGRPLALLSNAGFPASWLLHSAYGLSPSAIPKVDFIVSAGAETLAANIAVARLTGAPNIFCGSLRRYDPRGLRLVLTSYASQADRPRHVMVLKPSALCRGTLPGSPDRLAPGAVPQTMGLLLGGDSRECRFGFEDCAKLLELVERSHRLLGTRWVISNSRRTPAAMTDSFAAHVAAGSDAIDAFIDVGTTGPGTLGRVLERAEAIVCTDDSSTMISECVSAGLAVIGARPSRAVFTTDEQGYRKFLLDNGWYRSLPIAELTPDKLVRELARVQPLTKDPLDHLAGILRQRLPELFGYVPSPGAKRGRASPEFESGHQALSIAASPSSRRTSIFSPTPTD